MSCWWAIRESPLQNYGRDDEKEKDRDDKKEIFGKIIFLLTSPSPFLSFPLDVQVEALRGRRAIRESPLQNYGRDDQRNVGSDMRYKYTPAYWFYYIKLSHICNSIAILFRYNLSKVNSND